MAKSSRSGKYSVGSKVSELNRIFNAADVASKQNIVLNSVPEEKLGSNFQSLSFVDKSTIGGLLAVTAKDAKMLRENLKNNLEFENSVRIAGVKYTIKIKADDERKNLVYTVKQGNKFIVKNGTYENAANQLATIAKRRYK